MKRHHLIGLTIGLLGLLLLFLVLKDRGAPSTSLPARADFLGSSIVPSEIAAVRMEVRDEEGGSLSLVREGDLWIVEAEGARAPADSSWIDQLFEALSALDDGGEIRGRSAAVHDAFVIGDTQGIHIQLENASGETLQHLVVGKSSQDWSGTFLRLAEEETVYLVRTTLRQKLRTRGTQEAAKIDPTSWWNLRLFEIDANDLVALRVEGKAAVARSIELQSPEEESTTEDIPPEPEWIVTSGAALLNPGDLARSFAVARATKVVPPGTNTGLDANAEPAAIVHAETNEGEQLTLAFGNETEEGDGSRYVRRPGEAAVYVLPAYAVKNLLRAGEE